MSDTMLFGVLRMPYELAMSSELSRVQFCGRAQEAANLIESQAAQIARLTAERDKLLAALFGLVDAHARNVLFNGGGRWDAARAALQPIAPQDDKADDARAHFDRLDRMAQQEWAEVMDTRRRLEANAMDAAKEQGS